jgi:hypothetical protein
MKKIQLKRGLNINKESISKLQESQMVFLKGGCGGSGDNESCLLASCLFYTKRAGSCY